MVLETERRSLTNPLPESGVDYVVSRLELTKAIKTSFKSRSDKGPLDNDVAEEMADHVLNFFGYGERIIDNMLKTDDRDIFYMLEDLGILKTEREETTLYDGREWRINYWTLKKGYISVLTGRSKGNKQTLKNLGEKADDLNVYEELPEELWKRDG
jgi:hypothetical protein